MALKVNNQVETVTLRITRRSNTPFEHLELPFGGFPKRERQEQTPRNAPLNSPKTQQPKEKIEVESSSPHLNDVNSLTNIPERGRMQTRCFSQHSYKNPLESESPQQMITPEQSQIPKTATSNTGKKLLTQSSVPELSENQLPDLTLTVKKGQGSRSSEFLSPYNEERKSYRKTQKRQISSIPYRKCHDIFEARIVTIMNKMKGQKNCQKDLDGLVQKMQKISVKDMMNKYIISGFRTVIKIAKDQALFSSGENSNRQGKIIEKMQKQLEQIYIKISDELDRWDYFETSSPSDDEDRVDCRQYRRCVARKIYRMMKDQCPDKTKEELRSRTTELCQEFFHEEVNIVKVIKFIRGIESVNLV